MTNIKGIEQIILREINGNKIKAFRISNNKGWGTKQGFEGTNCPHRFAPGAFQSRRGQNGGQNEHIRGQNKQVRGQIKNPRALIYQGQGTKSFICPL